MLPTVQKFILPSLLAILTAITVLFSSPKHLSVQQHANTQTKNVLGSSAFPTPTSQVVGKQNADYIKIVPTSTPKANTSSQHVTENAAVVISPTPSSIPSQQHESEVPTPTITPNAQNTTIHAQTTIIASGKTIHLSMQYPSLGGPITGTISGDCSGSLSGAYAGPSTQTLHGSGTATCPMGFLSIPVSLIYNGKLISPTLASISYSATAVGKTENGTTQLVLVQ